MRGNNKPYYIQLLGGFCVTWRGANVVRFRTQKTGHLLAYLAYYLERTHPRDQLIDIVWPDALDLGCGRNSLNVALSSLRRQFEPRHGIDGPLVIADRSQVRLNPQAVHTDVEDFRGACGAGDSAHCVLDRDRLEVAFAAYQGSLLPGCYEDWAQEEGRYLSERYLQISLALCKAREQGGDLMGAIAVIRQSLTIDPLREEMHRELVRLLDSAGRLTEALAHYALWRQQSVENLGIEPEIATQALARRIAQGASVPVATTFQAVACTAPAALQPHCTPAMSAAGPTTRACDATQPTVAYPPPIGGLLTFAVCQPLWADLPVDVVCLAEQRGGRAFCLGGTSGAAFPRASDALAYSIEVQRLVHPKRFAWVLVLAQMGTPTEPLQLAIDFARPLLAAVHVGQIVCTEAVALLLRNDGDREPGVSLRNLGQYIFPPFYDPERLFQASYPGMAGDVFPPLRARHHLPTHLPLPLTRFFGRNEELDRIVNLLTSDGTRLVTLHGPGGIGKTRVAIEAARRMANDGLSDVRFAALADVDDPRHIPETLLAALQCPRDPSREPMAVLLERLSQEPTTLVLDNFEQLIEDGSLIVHRLLEGAPQLRLLITSRQVLDLTAERVVPIPTLPSTLSEAPLEELLDAPAVQLFADRAQYVRPDFQLSATNARVIARLCAALDGIPLAIELAAARAAILTPSQMLSRLQDRFRLLEGSQRDRATRHKKMRTAIDWSFQLLDPDLQIFFRRLSVFRGGWTLTAAERVCDEGPVLEQLCHLQQCSLVQGSETGGEMRFRLLETLREYAAEKIPEDELRVYAARHAHFFTDLAEKAGRQIEGPDQASWLDTMGVEHDNLRAATSSMRDAGLNSEFVRLALAQFPLLDRWGMWDEAERILTEADTRLHLLPGDTRDLRADVARALGSIAQDCGQTERARALALTAIGIRESLSHAGGLADARILAALIEIHAGNYEQATELLHGCLADLEPEDHLRRAKVHGNLGLIFWNTGDLVMAKQRYHDSLNSHQAVGNLNGQASQLLNLGAVAGKSGDFIGSERLCKQSLVLYRRLGNMPRLGLLLNNLGYLAQLRGDLEQAVRLCCQSRRMLHDLRSSDVRHPELCLQGLKELLGQERFEILSAGAAQLSWKAEVDKYDDSQASTPLP